MTLDLPLTIPSMLVATILGFEHGRGNLLSYEEAYLAALPLVDAGFKLYNLQSDRKNALRNYVALNKNPYVKGEKHIYAENWLIGVETEFFSLKEKQAFMGEVMNRYLSTSHPKLQAGKRFAKTSIATVAAYSASYFVGTTFR